MKLKNIWVFLLLGVFILVSPITAADLQENELSTDTSIVMLIISEGENEVYTDPFFEILLLEEEDNYLLPLTLLNPYLDMNINFKRDEGQIIVTNTQNNEKILIDLESEKYPDNPEWNGKGPLVFSDDFFVSAELISELFNIDIEWNPAYQELLLIGDIFSEDYENHKDDKDFVKEEKEVEVDKIDNIVSSSDVSIGSIHYQYKLNYRHSDSLADIIQNKAHFSLFGNYNNWIVSLGTKVGGDINREEYNISFPLIEIKHGNDNHFIQIGDSNFNFDYTKGDNKLRGIKYSHPRFPRSRVISITSVSVTGDIGDEVFLLVNGRVFKNIKLIKEEYIFEEVPLDNNRLNKIEIIIRKKDGSEKVETKNIAASPLINSEDILENEIIVGLYRNKSLEQWEGYIAGLSLNYTPLKDITTRLETTVYKERLSNLLKQGTDIGITTLWGKRAVVSLDLLSSRDDYINDFGGRGEIKYFFPRGVIEGSYLYLPVKAAQVVQYNQGERLHLKGRLLLSSGLYLNSGILSYHTLAQNELFQSNKANLALTYDKGWKFSNTIGVSTEKVKSFFSFPEEGLNFPGKNEKLGLSYYINYFAPGFKGKGEINIYDNNIYLDNFLDRNFQEGKIKVDLYKKFGSSILINNDFNLSGMRYNDSFYNIDKERKTKIGYVSSKGLSIFLQNSVKDLETDDTSWEEMLLTLEKYWNKNKLLVLKAGEISSSTELDYYLGGITGQYFSLKKPEMVTIFFDYIKPKLDNIEGQVTYGINYKKSIWNNNDLEVSLGKDYYSFLSDTGEFYLKISLSSALGFAGEKIIPQSYNGKKHISFVAGIVYLDENRNNKYDKGETRLSDINIRLNNIVAESNERGEYIVNVNFPGIYEIGFDLNELPADYTPVTPSQKINIEGNQNIYLDFGLTINGSISGKVFHDYNANGEIDKNDKPLKWVGISLNNEERLGYTDSRGEFYFENVPLGYHTLTILSDSLPGDVVPNHDLPINVFINKENLDVSEILLPLIYKFD